MVTKTWPVSFNAVATNSLGAHFTWTRTQPTCVDLAAIVAPVIVCEIAVVAFFCAAHHTVAARGNDAVCAIP
jgi:hypothetical protein